MIRTVILLALCAGPALADPPQITAATVRQDGSSWSFDVTLAHPDTGWGHYADGWRIEAPDGTIFGLRKLAHPHGEEQPFTRTLSGIGLPEGLTEVRIPARCNLDGWAEATFPLTLR